MDATAAVDLPPEDAAARTEARRLRFREAVSRLADRAQSTDVVRWVLVPGSISVLVGFNFMLFGWVGASRTYREIEQIPYLISGGIVGLALVFLGGLMLASTFWMVLLRKFQEEAEERSRQQVRDAEERFARLVTELQSSAASNGTRTRARKSVSRS